jgi:hypothetical protein
VGKIVEQFSVDQRRGQKRQWAEKWLEIRLQSPVDDELLKVLVAERELKFPTSGRGNQKFYPTQGCAEETTVRVLWNGRSDIVVPKLENALAVLSDLVGIHDAEIRDQVDMVRLSDAEFSKHLSEMCANGNFISAVA